MIQTAIHDDICEILLDNPPVNALAAGVRLGLVEAINAANANPAVRGIVIRGNGRMFSGGADISEFDAGLTVAPLPEVVDLIEASAKPVVAAIHGTCLGGGLEIALGCHYRIATPATRLGLPEVKLGILPGAGGTQRLPRLTGAEAALDMVVFGNPIAAAKALEIGLIDAITDDANLVSEAIALARSAKSTRPSRAETVSATPDLFDQFTATHARKIALLDAPKACIAAVRAAAEQPFDQGMQTEGMLFQQLVTGDQCRALRHIFFAERAAAKIKDLPAGTALRPINRVGIIGAGTMGGGIAMNFLSAGLPVTIVETSQEALDRGVGVVGKNYGATVSKGRMSEAQRDKAMGLLTPTLDFAALADCDLIIEAVYENMDVKKDIFTRLDAIAKPGAILASNTSFLDIDAIAAVTQRPQDVLGLHFFSPANVMKLLEVVRGKATAPDALATAMDIARRIRKVAVVAGVCYGFIGNRILLQRQDQASALLLEGASPEQIDRVHTAFGLPMGPFQMADLAGVDIGWHRDPERIESIAEALCAKGRWGQKTQAGYYDYDDKRRPSPSPVTQEIVDSFRTREGVSPRAISEEEIVARTLYIMVNEGAKILEEGIAQRASDIDVVWVFGYGWPSFRGGPMLWADMIGLDTVVAGLEKYRAHLGPDFTLSPLLRDRAAAGKSLAD